MYYKFWIPSAQQLLAVYLVTYSLNRLLGADFLTISVCIFWISSLGDDGQRQIHEEALLHYFDPDTQSPNRFACVHVPYEILATLF